MDVDSHLFLPTFPEPTSICSLWGQVLFKLSEGTLVSWSPSTGQRWTTTSFSRWRRLVSAGGWSPEDLSFSLACVGVRTRTYSQNKSVPVWEISVKSVFCKSWPGSCFHITNQRQFAVFLGASVSSYSKKKDVTRSRAAFLQNLSPGRCVSSSSQFSGAGCRVIAWPQRYGKGKPVLGDGDNLQKRFLLPWCSQETSKYGHVGSSCVSPFVLVQIISSSTPEKYRARRVVFVLCGVLFGFFF